MNPRVSRSSALASKATGFPDRQDRRPPGRRLHPGRDPQRHHRRDAGQFRADHRLRGHQGPPVGVREVPGHPGHPRDPDAIGRARRWPSAATSPSRCKKRCGRSRRVGPASIATRPNSSTRPDRRRTRGQGVGGHPGQAVPPGGGPAPRGVRRAAPRRKRRRPVVPGPDRPHLRTSGPAWRRWARRRLCTDGTGAGPSGSVFPTRSWPTCGGRARPTSAPPGLAAG